MSPQLAGAGAADERRLIAGFERLRLLRGRSPVDQPAGGEPERVLAGLVDRVRGQDELGPNVGGLEARVTIPAAR